MATDFEIAVMKELGEIKSVSSSTSASLTALNERLFGEGSGVITNLQADIDEIKTDRIADKKMDRIESVIHYSLAPVLVALHILAHRFKIGNL